MINIQAANDGSWVADTEIWHNLKSAIASSSGFQRWLSESTAQIQGFRLDEQVQRYLRETLENLAY
jgi:hypothetical protein